MAISADSKPNIFPSITIINPKLRPPARSGPRRGRPSDQFRPPNAASGPLRPPVPRHSPDDNLAQLPVATRSLRIARAISSKLSPRVALGPQLLENRPAFRMMHG